MIRRSLQCLVPLTLPFAVAALAACGGSTSSSGESSSSDTVDGGGSSFTSGGSRATSGGSSRTVGSSLGTSNVTSGAGSTSNGSTVVSAGSSTVAASSSPSASGSSQVSSSGSSDVSAAGSSTISASGSSPTISGSTSTTSGSGSTTTSSSSTTTTTSGSLSTTSSGSTTTTSGSGSGATTTSGSTAPSGSTTSASGTVAITYGTGGATATSGASTATNGLVTVVLGGCPATGYTAPVQVHDQTVQLIVDTGSTDLAVALSSCANCDTEATVNPTNGICGTTPESSFYGDGSGWNGDKCTSTVQVGGEVPAVSMSFAGITRQSNGFFRDQDCSGNTVAKSPADGIIGFGPLDIDDIGHHPADAYFQELATQGIANAFSVLLCTQGGGDMWFGGYDESFTDGSAPQFTGIVGGGFWNVDLTSFGLGTGANAIDLGGGDNEALVDTGTELLYMAPTAFSAMAGDLANNSGVVSVFGSGVINRNFFNQFRCATPTGNQTRAEVDAALPPLTMTFPNVGGGGTFTVALPATQSYLSASGSGSNTQYCAAAASSGSSQAGSTILGDSVLGSHITIFDIGQHQIGFVTQNTCN